MIDFIRQVLLVIGEALQGNPELLQIVASQPASRAVAFAVPFLAGVSLLLGRSGVLFANRVSRGRFIFSLLMYGLVFLISQTLNAFAIWLAVILFQDAAPDITKLLGIVLLSNAPLVLGIFVLVPYLGVILDWILNIWSLIILVHLAIYNFSVSVYGVLIFVFFGWLLSQLLLRIANRPLTNLRDWIWRTVTGVPFEMKLQAQIDRAAVELSRALRHGRRK